MPRDFKSQQTNPQKRLHAQQQTDPYQCRERWISCLHFHEILSRKNSLTWQSFISKVKKYSGKYFLWCSKSFQELLFLTSRLSLGEATWYYSLFTSKMCQVTKGHFQKMVLAWAWRGNLLLLLLFEYDATKRYIPSRFQPRPRWIFTIWISQWFLSWERLIHEISANLHHRCCLAKMLRKKSPTYVLLKWLAEPFLVE